MLKTALTKEFEKGKGYKYFFTVVSFLIIRLAINNYSIANAFINKQFNRKKYSLYYLASERRIYAFF